MEYETAYQELKKRTEELMLASAQLAVTASLLDSRNPSKILREKIDELNEVHGNLHKFMELEVKGFEDNDTIMPCDLSNKREYAVAEEDFPEWLRNIHFGKKLAPRVGKLQLIFETLSEIQRNMLQYEHDTARSFNALTDQLEMDNMRWCEEVSEILKSWYNQRTKID